MDFPGEEIRMDVNLIALATLVCLPTLMTTPLPGPLLTIVLKLFTQICNKTALIYQFEKLDGLV